MSGLGSRTRNVCKTLFLFTTLKLRTVHQVYSLLSFHVASFEVLDYPMRFLQGLVMIVAGCIFFDDLQIKPMLAIYLIVDGKYCILATSLLHYWLISPLGMIGVLTQTMDHIAGSLLSKDLNTTWKKLKKICCDLMLIFFIGVYLTVSINGNNFIYSRKRFQWFRVYSYFMKILQGLSLLCSACLCRTWLRSQTIHWQLFLHGISLFGSIFFLLWSRSDASWSSPWPPLCCTLRSRQNVRIWRARNWPNLCKHLRRWGEYLKERNYSKNMYTFGLIGWIFFFKYYDGTQIIVHFFFGGNYWMLFSFFYCIVLELNIQQIQHIFSLSELPSG